MQRMMQMVKDWIHHPIHLIHHPIHLIQIHRPIQMMKQLKQVVKEVSKPEK